jgi:integrase
MKQGFTDVLVKNLTRPGRYTDPQTRGLNIQVKAGGGKYWAYRFSYGGKRTDLSLGSYPDVSLKQARARAVKARAELLTGGPPSSIRNVQMELQPTPQRPRFQEFAKECVESKSAEWGNKKHAAQWTSTIAQYATPVIGDMPIDEIGTDEILRVLNPIWRKRTETASRLRGRLEWILAVAIAKGLRPAPNPASWRGHLETILPRPKKIKPVKHHPALNYSDIPTLIERLHDTDSPAALALEFLILNAARTGEVIGAVGSEVSDEGLWVIPAHRMKAAKEHRVPLGRRSLEIIATAIKLGGDSPFIFARQGKPLSNMAMSMLLRRLGYSDITVHGFRSTFRTWVAEETHHPNEVAEMALAHTIGNRVEAAYRRGDLLARRREMMNDWERHCLSTVKASPTLAAKRLAA